VSGGHHLRGFCARAHTIKVATVASRWQRVGDLIGSGYLPHQKRMSYHLCYLAGNVHDKYIVTLQQRKIKREINFCVRKSLKKVCDIQATNSHF